MDYKTQKSIFDVQQMDFHPKQQINHSSLQINHYTAVNGQYREYQQHPYNLMSPNSESYNSMYGFDSKNISSSPHWTSNLNHYNQSDICYIPLVNQKQNYYHNNKPKFSKITEHTRETAFFTEPFYYKENRNNIMNIEDNSDYHFQNTKQNFGSTYMNNSPISKNLHCKRNNNKILFRQRSRSYDQFQFHNDSSLNYKSYDDPSHRLQMLANVTVIQSEKKKTTKRKPGRPRKNKETQIVNSPIHSSPIHKLYSDSDAKIRIGHEYQVYVDDACIDFTSEIIKQYPHPAYKVWQPIKSDSEENLSMYLKVASSNVVYGGGDNKELAHHLLFRSRYNFKLAISLLVSRDLRINSEDPLVNYNYTGTSIWTREEKVNFFKAFKYCGKDFLKISRQIKTKNRAECIEAYYAFKTMHFDSIRRQIPSKIFEKDLNHETKSPMFLELPAPKLLVDIADNLKSLRKLGPCHLMCQKCVFLVNQTQKNSTFVEKNYLGNSCSDISGDSENTSPNLPQFKFCNYITLNHEDTSDRPNNLTNEGHHSLIPLLPQVSIDEAQKSIPNLYSCLLCGKWI